MKKYLILASLSFGLIFQTSVASYTPLLKEHFLDENKQLQQNLRPLNHIENIRSFGHADISNLDGDELNEQSQLMMQYAQLLAGKSFSDSTDNSIEYLVWASHWASRAARFSGKGIYDKQSILYLQMSHLKEITYSKENPFPFFYKAYAIRYLEQSSDNWEEKINLLNQLQEMVEKILVNKDNNVPIYSPTSLRIQSGSNYEPEWYRTMFTDLGYPTFNSFNTFGLTIHSEDVLNSIVSYKESLENVIQ
jgi:hypothetical protein